MRTFWAIFGGLVALFVARRWYRRHAATRAAAAGAAATPTAAGLGVSLDEYPSTGAGGIAAAAADQTVATAGDTLTTESPYADGSADGGPALGGGKTTSLYAGTSSLAGVALYTPRAGLSPKPSLPIPPRPLTTRRFALTRIATSGAR